MKFFYFVRLFSLDVISGAIASLVFAATLFSVKLSFSYYLILAVTVGLIYTTDHLMDGARTKGKSVSDVSNFFYKYRIPVILGFLMMLVFDVRLIIYTLDERIVQYGIGPGLASVVYLFLNRYHEGLSRWVFIKELWISVIYTLAIFGGPVILAGENLYESELLIIFAFFLLVFANVLLFSIYEKEKDLMERNRSIVVDFGLRSARIIEYCVLSLSALLALSATLFFGVHFLLSLPILLISLMLFLIVAFPEVFWKRKLYSVLADGSFLLLLISLFL